MRQVEFLALRAHHELPGLERQVAAAAVAGTLLNLSLRKSTHWEKLLSIRPPPAKEKRQRHISQMARDTAGYRRRARERIIADAPGVSRQADAGYGLLKIP